MRQTRRFPEFSLLSGRLKSRLETRSGPRGSLPGPNHPNHWDVFIPVGMIWAKSSYHPNRLATMVFLIMFGQNSPFGCHINGKIMCAARPWLYIVDEFHQRALLPLTIRLCYVMLCGSRTSRSAETATARQNIRHCLNRMRSTLKIHSMARDQQR